jgi:N-methylhydantoinase A
MDVFATCDRDSPIEVVGWRARVQCQLRESVAIAAAAAPDDARPAEAVRPAWFPGHSQPLETAVRRFDAIAPGTELGGPAIVESPVTTIVIDPGTRVVGVPGGSLVVAVDDARTPEPRVGREVTA